MIGLPILSQTTQGGPRGQATLDNYFPYWMVDHKNWQNQNHIQQSLTPQEQRDALMILRDITARWQSQLRRNETGS